MIALAVLHIISLLLFSLVRGDSVSSSEVKTLALLYILSGLGMSLYFILSSLYKVF